jgi:ABC-type multidrug transport system fused ATPase/permease subunit
MLKFLQKGICILAVGFHILSAAVGPSSTFVTSKFIDNIATTDSIYLYLPIFSGLCAAAILLGICSTYFTNILSINVGKAIRRKLYHKILSLDPTVFEKHSVGEYTTKFSSDVGAITTGLKVFIPMFIGSSFTFIWYTVYSFILHPPFGYIIVGLGVAVVISSYLPYRKTMAKTLQAQKNISLAGGFITETLTGFKTIFAFQQQKLFEDKFTQFLNAITRAEKSSLYIYAASVIANNLLTSGTLVVAAYVCYVEVAAGNTTIGNVVALWTTLSGATLSLKQAMFAVNDATKMKAASINLEKILNLEPSKGFGTRKELPDSPVDIKFENVGFAYSSLTVFTGLSFSILEGSITSIVGPSGVGKSTIVSLLLGFQKPKEGQISIGSENILNFEDKWLKSQIGYVPQDVHIFSETIEFNIRFGNQSIEHDKVVEAARIVGIHDTIMELPEGYKTVIGNKGVTFSGGQKQRIAIARAILHNPPILVLDEATSALDSANEKIVGDALLTLREKGTTIIIIAHRMKTVSISDNIFVLLNGSIVEEGTFAQLIAAGGVFATMVKNQETTKYVEEIGRKRSSTL